MTATRPQPGNKAVLQRAGLDKLIEVLRARSYQVLGPTLRDGAIVYDELASADDLPAGWTDEQNGAQYRLKRREDQALFAYVVGPHSWKRYLHPPILCLTDTIRCAYKRRCLTQSLS